MADIKAERGYAEAGAQLYAEEEARYERMARQRRAAAAAEEEDNEEALRAEETRISMEADAAEMDDIEQEHAYAAELHSNRLSDYLHVRDQVEQLATRVAAKLTKMIEEGNAYETLTIVLFFAILKDGLLDIGLDFIGIGLIPIVGAIPGLFVDAIIYALTGGSMGKKMGLRAGVWIAGFFIDAMPLFEELPITTILVFWWWHQVRKEALAASQHLGELGEKTQEELEALDGDYEEGDAGLEESYA